MVCCGCLWFVPLPLAAIAMEWGMREDELALLGFWGHRLDLALSNICCMVSHHDVRLGVK